MAGSLGACLSIQAMPLACTALPERRVTIRGSPHWLGSGAGLSLEECQLVRAVTLGPGNRTGEKALPDAFLTPGHFEEPAIVRIDNQSVAVGQTLFHASEESVERRGIVTRIDPGNGLRDRIILEDAASLAGTEIVEQK